MERKQSTHGLYLADLFISLILLALCLTASPFTLDTAHLCKLGVFSVDNMCPPDAHLFSNTQAHQ
jgi:hypothetical protein